MLILLKSTILESFWAFVAALVTGALLARPGLELLIALKSRQTIYSLAPESHQKKQGTPTMGGIIILVGLLAGLLVIAQDWKLSLWILGFAAIGFTDDFVVPRMLKGKRGLGWKQKIVPQLALAILAAPVFNVPFKAVPVALTAFLVLFFSNAYNFSDGLDGLAGSLGLILCFGFAAMSPALVFCGPVLGALAGAFIPFLFLNAPPAKVFMGDVGSLPIGAVFGGIAAFVLVGGRMSQSGIFVQTGQLVWLGPLLVLSFVMIAELVPVPMQVAYYKVTKKRLFPMTPIHHAFEKKGWPESRVVWLFILTQLVLCITAVGWSVSLTKELPPPARYHYYYFTGSDLDGAMRFEAQSRTTVAYFATSPPSLLAEFGDKR